MTATSSTFYDAFGGATSAGSACLISLLEPKRAIQLRRVCKCMQEVVDANLTDYQITQLSERLRKLSIERRFSLIDTPRFCRENQTFVEYAVRRNGLDYQHASEELKQNLFIIKTALTSTQFFAPKDLPTFLKSIGPTIAKRPDIQALVNSTELYSIPRKDRWTTLGFCAELTGFPRPHREDKDIILNTVVQNFMAFADASPELKANKEVVLALVKSNGFTIQFASHELRADKEVVLAAVEQKGVTLAYASPELRDDKEVVLTAIRQDAMALHAASPKMRADKEVVLTAIRKDGFALLYASSELKDDRKVVLTAVLQNREALGYASRELRADKELIEAARKTEA
jgi:hypothetical protein